MATKNQMAKTAYAEAYLHNALPSALRPLSLVEILEARREAGRMSPLEVILTSMDKFVEEANAIALEVEAARTSKQRKELKLKLQGMVGRAVDVAKDAAPYCHAKLANVKLSGDEDNPLAFKLYDVSELRAKVRGAVIDQLPAPTVADGPE